MLNQSDDLNYCFLVVVISDRYLFQEIVLLNHCFIFYKNLILSFIDKATTGTKGLAGTAGVIDILDTTHSFDRDKSSSVSQIIKGK